jgi:hypothetical protein
MTDDERYMTKEERRKFLEPRLAKARRRLELLRKETRNEFLQRSLDRMKKNGVPPDRRYSDRWWEYIPDFEETRNWLTGFYKVPLVNSQVVICKDHPFVDPWMREKGVFGLVLSIKPPKTITLVDEYGYDRYDKDGNRVRIPGISDVEVAFPETDYEGGLFLPADYLEMREYDEYDEHDEYAEDAEDDETKSN